jgi:hypothetical protein
MQKLYLKGKSLKYRLIAQCKIIGDCWIWQASKDRDGYGKLRFEGKRIRAHRASFLVHNGEIPDNLCVLHKCDVPACINPDHLWLGTHADNSKDRHKKGRTVKGNAKITQAIADEIRLIRNRDKISQWDIANKFGVTQACVWNVLQNKNWKTEGFHPTPILCKNNAKLTKSQVLEMRKLSKNGTKLKALSQLFPQVKYLTISDIVHRRRWKHI